MLKQNRLYNDLAWLWPVLSPPEEYIEEAEFLASLIKSYMKFTPKSMLHLGCGGGHIDMTLKKHFRLTGVDRSENMLNLARKLNPENDYISGDMRDVRLGLEFDVVLVYDGVNYITSESDLESVFRTAYEHLAAGGLVLTVVEETPDNFRQNKTKIQHRAKDNIELTYIMHWYDPDQSDSTYETAFVYLIREDKILKPEPDLHICGIFDLKVWEDVFKKAGFAPQKDTFRHSTFSPGEEYPIMIGIKK